MIIGWQLHAYNLPYLREAIAAAESYGVNHIQLSHDIMMYLKHVTGDLLRPKQFNELIDQAHRRGMQVFYWIHALSYVPDEYMVGRRADLDAHGLWEHEAQEYATVAHLTPEFDGIILSFGDCCHYHMYDDRQVVSKLGKTERLQKYIAVARDALSARGKRLYVRDWAGGRWAREAIQGSPVDVGVMTKTDVGDWQHTDPHNPYIGAFPEREQLVEFDLCGEYHGRAWTPWCAPEYIRHRWRFAQTRGVAGAVGRVDAFDLGHELFCNPYGVPSEVGPSWALNTPNEVNLRAFTDLIRDSSVDIDQTWRTWTRQRYGERCAERVVMILKRTFEIADKLFWRRSYVGLMKTVPTLGYLERVTRVEGILGRPLEEFLDTASFNHALEEEYADVEALYGQCLAELEGVRLELPQSRHRELLDGFEALRFYLSAWRQVHRAFIRYKLYERTAKIEHHEGVSGEMQGILDLAGIIERRFGPHHWPSNPARLRNFAGELRDVSNYFQKQLLRTNTPDLQTSIFQAR